MHVSEIQGGNFQPLVEDPKLDKQPPVTVETGVTLVEIVFGIWTRLLEYLTDGVVVINVKEAALHAGIMPMLTRRRHVDGGDEPGTFEEARGQKIPNTSHVSGFSLASPLLS